ncbi:MAG: ferritin family protein [Desulfobacterota bacterium]|nr:ferritin family protein [Thermodesulfobacteriota bacterium]
MLKESYACQHCGAEADITLEGFDRVEDVLRRAKRGVCKACGKEVEIEPHDESTFACQNCGAEADMTLEGFDSVEDVLKREKGLICQTCGREVHWTDREDLKAIKVAMEAEKEAHQAYAKAAKGTRDPKGRDMFQQLAEFELNHFQKLKALLQSLEEKGEWIPYEGTHLKIRKIALVPDLPEKEDLTELDALKMAIQEEKKAQHYYRTLAELTRDPKGKEMYRRLAEEEALHEKVLNDQYYSLHNKGIWSWGD